MRELIGDKPVTIGEAAAHFGLAPSTLRWWEQQGLLVPTELFAGHATTQHWHDTFRDRIREIDRQIEQLATARGWLSHALGCQADDPTRCSHLDSCLDEELDEFAARHLTPGSISTRDMFRHEFRHRHESRDRTGVPPAPQACCKVCGVPVPQARTGRLRTYCSHACRQRAYRARTDRNGRADSHTGLQSREHF
jgi:MerR family copper efflux transcriptional regulator